MSRRTNATWGLQRISQATEPTDQNTGDLTFTYTYDDSAGEGVDIYVVDTGIFTNHVCIVTSYIFTWSSGLT